MANVVKVRWNWSLGDIPDVWCVAHVKAADSHAPATLLDLANLAQAAFGWWKDPSPDFDAASALYGSLIRLQTVTAQRIEPDESLEVALPAEGWAGTLPTGDTGGLSQYSPPQACALVGLRTTVEGRTTRGRLFLPAMSWSGTQDEKVRGSIPGVWLGFLGECAARMAEAFRFAPLMDEAEWVLAVYSRKLGTSLAVTHFTVSAHLQTQRRRAATPIVRRFYGLDGVEFAP